jgi:hypothetical protein
MISVYDVTVTSIEVFGIFEATEQALILLYIVTRVGLVWSTQKLVWSLEAPLADTPTVAVEIPAEPAAALLHVIHDWGGKQVASHVELEAVGAGAGTGDGAVEEALPEGDAGDGADWELDPEEGASPAISAGSIKWQEALGAKVFNDDWMLATVLDGPLQKPPKTENT